MKQIIIFLFMASVACGETDITDSLVPVAYSNETRFVKYVRSDGYRTVTNCPYAMDVINCQVTNAPVAIVHVVTYGVGAKAMFKLWSVEVLKVPEAPWRNAEWKYYEPQTWITKP